MKSRAAKCPNCGNTNRETIQSNGSRTDLTYLCVARVPVADRAWGHVDPESDQIDDKGRVECGEQWCPDAD